jgi:SNF2 family DNA or RNA helicase
VETLEQDDSPLGQKHLKILAEIMRLRQACCHPRLVVPESDLTSSKLALFGEVVEDLLENSQKALVFSQFVSHLTLISDYLKKKGIEFHYLDGSTPAKERRREVEAFQAGQGSLFLISLRAGGVGINLTAADYVIHMDPWWNPAVEDQASDRAHRIGQRRPVTVYRLVTKNTIEEKILKLHSTKRDLANSLLDGADISGRMSADELLQLIREG